MERNCEIRLLKTDPSNTGKKKYRPVKFRNGFQNTSLITGHVRKLGQSQCEIEVRENWGLRVVVRVHGKEKLFWGHELKRCSANKLVGDDPYKARSYHQRNRRKLKNVKVTLTLTLILTLTPTLTLTLTLTLTHAGRHGGRVPCRARVHKGPSVAYCTCRELAAGVIHGLNRKMFARAISARDEEDAAACSTRQRDMGSRNETTTGTSTGKTRYQSRHV